MTRPRSPQALTGHVVVRRRWKYAPPPRVMYDAIVSDADRWLRPLPGETRPEVAGSRRPEWVRLRPWFGGVVEAVDVHLEADGPGTQLTVLAYAPIPALADEDRHEVRHRLGTCFGAALREWVDEPHD